MWFASFRRDIVENSALPSICTALVGFLPATYEDGSVKISRNVGLKTNLRCAATQKSLCFMYFTHLCKYILFTSEDVFHITYFIQGNLRIIRSTCDVLAFCLDVRNLSPFQFLPIIPVIK